MSTTRRTLEAQRRSAAVPLPVLGEPPFHAVHDADPYTPSSSALHNIDESLKAVQALEASLLPQLQTLAETVAMMKLRRETSHTLAAAQSGTPGLTNRARRASNPGGVAAVVDNWRHPSQQLPHHDEGALPAGIVHSTADLSTMMTMAVSMRRKQAQRAGGAGAFRK